MNAEHQGTGSLPSATNTPTDTSDSESLIPITNLEHPTATTSASSRPKKPSTKTTLINYLRTLHAEILHRHEFITGFDLRLYQSQQHVVVAFAEGLLGLDYRADARRGEIGIEAYYAYLQQAPIWEIRGKIWEVEHTASKLEGFMVGMMCASERNRIREIEEDLNGRQDREDYRGGETWGGWLWRKIWWLSGSRGN